MRKLILVSLACLFASLPAFSQTENEKKLEQAVKNHEALEDYVAKLTGTENTTETLKYIEDQEYDNVSVLDDLIEAETGQLRSVARLYRMYFKVEYAEAMGRDDQEFMKLRELEFLETDFASFSEGDFPLRFSYDGETHVINYKNFIPRLASYHLNMAELCSNNAEKAEKSLKYARLAMAFKPEPDSPTNTLIRFVGAALVLKYKMDANRVDEEAVTAALRSLEEYKNLDEEYRKIVSEEDSGYKKPAGYYADLVVLLKAKPTLARGGKVWAEAGGFLAKNNEPKSAADAYNRALSAGQNSPDFLREVMFFAETNNQKPLGLTAAQRFSNQIAETDCDGWQQVTTIYKNLGEPKLAAETQKKADACLKKAGKAARKESKKASGGFNLYAGGYVFPLVSKSPDFGGVVNFVFPKAAIEFSYLLVDKNKENVVDLALRNVDAKSKDFARWNGFYAHVQPKFQKKNRKSYTGLLFGYAQKDFETMTASATENATAQVSVQTFKPTVKQYIFMLNSGMCTLRRGFGVDVYSGIGATYNQFGIGNPLDRKAFTVEDPVLQNRKDTFFNVIFRFGMTVGLNIGRGNK